LIRAEGDAAMEGLSFALNAQSTSSVGRGHLTFPEDGFVSPKHANLFYRDGKLVCADEHRSTASTFVCADRSKCNPANMFLAGEEVFRVDATRRRATIPKRTARICLVVTKRPSPFRVCQILQAGQRATWCARARAASPIGREGGDMNFPTTST